jgi:hypothetical protein
MLIVVITGPVLAVAGIGGSLWSLIGFLVIFGVAVVPLTVHELRPAVTLLSSSEHSRRSPACRTGFERLKIADSSEVSTRGQGVHSRPRGFEGVNRGVRFVDP